MRGPLTWVSKIQTHIALSKMESEYIALSQLMRSLISLSGILQEIKVAVFSGKMPHPDLRAHSHNFDPIPASTLYEDNSACLKFLNTKGPVIQSS